MVQSLPARACETGIRPLSAISVPDTDFQMIADAQRFAAGDIHWVGNRLACYELSLAAARRLLQEAESVGHPVDVNAVAGHLEDARQNEIQLRRLILCSRLNLIVEMT